jgi:hypothetical protein
MMKESNIEELWQTFKKQTHKSYKYQRFINKFKWLRDGETREVIKPLAYKEGFVASCKGISRFLGKAILNNVYTLFHPGKVLDRPIFVIGMPHSGTTIFMKLLAEHSDISNSSEMNTFFYPDGRYVLPECDHYKTAEMATPKEIKRLNKRFNFYRYIHGNNARFLNKNPINMIAVEYLKACFPDAYIIHIVRDPRAYINSSIYSLPSDIESHDRFKAPEERVNIYPGPRTADWRDHIKEDPIEQHAVQWKNCLELVRGQSKKIDNYFETRYEDLCEDTRGIVKKVWEFVGLDPEKDAEKVPVKLESKNYKYSKRFTKEEIQLVEEITSDLMSEYNYEKLKF